MTLCSQWTMELVHCALCHATLIEDLSNRQTKLLFVCTRWQIVRFWCTLEWKQNTAEQNNKHLYEQFRFPWRVGWIEDEPEGTFWYIFLCNHPTITIREHLLLQVRKTFQGKKYNFYRLFTFISGTTLYRSYFGGIFCLNGSNLRLVLGHPRTTPQVVFSRGRDKNPD